MPGETLSDKGPGGGGWIHMNKHLQVTTKEGEMWGNGNIYAIGDCNYGCIGNPDDWKSGKGMYPVPKISYPAEEQALHAVRNIIVTDRQKHGKSGWECCPATKLKETWWPWG